MFINNFTLEKIYELGEGNEVIVTFDANNNHSKIFLPFRNSERNQYHNF